TGAALTNSTPVITKVQEPLLVLTKDLIQTTADAGDLVGVVFTVTNKGTASAYDLSITDVLNPFYFDTNASIAVALPTGYVFSVISNGFTVHSDTNSATGTNTMEPGEYLSFTCQVTMAQSMPLNTSITNTATLGYDSLAGTNIYAIQRSRTTNATDTIQGLNLTIAKSLYGTSETNIPPDSVTTNVQIGERVTYKIDVSIPESTVTNLQVVDVLPVGMAFITNSMRLDTNGFGGTLGVVSKYVAMGAGLVAAAWVLLFAGVCRTWRRVSGTAADLGSRQSNKFALLLGPLLGLTALLLHSFVDFNFHIPANAILAITLMAVVSSCQRFSTEKHWKAPKLPAKLQAQAPARADRAVLERARLLARSGKPEEAKKLLQAFPQDFKDSQLRADADKQLAALGGTP
ncbi:MAG: hypothetical protein WCS72_17825, partial [Deltaproteobacteria bacterium]